MIFYIKKIFIGNKFIFFIFFLISISFFFFFKENNSKFLTNINVDIKEDNFINTDFSKKYNFNDITTDKKNILLDIIKKDFNIDSVKIINKNKIRLAIILQHEENINIQEIKNVIEIYLFNNLNDNLKNMRLILNKDVMLERAINYKNLYILCSEIKQEYNSCLERIILNNMYIDNLYKEHHDSLLLFDKSLKENKIFNINSKTIKKNYTKKILNHFFINIILFILIYFFYKKLKKNLFLFR
jgi:hypothetical protein